jgi:hypothetical protein
VKNKPSQYNFKILFRNLPRTLIKTTKILMINKVYAKIRIQDISSVMLCVFRGQIDSIQRIFIEKRFMFTVESVYSVKRFTAGSRNSLKNVRKVANNGRTGAEVAETTKDFYTAGF